MSVFMLGPLGSLRPLVTFPEVPVEVERPSSSWTSLGGRRYEQRAPRAQRSWELDYRLMDPADLAYLAACADGSIPGPLYLYRQDAADTNLLPAEVAAPGLMGVSGLLLPGGGQPARDRVLVRVGGAVASVSGVSCDPGGAGEWSRTVPLPLGSYRLSGWATSSGSALLWRTVNAAGGQVATGTVSVSSSSGSFRGEVAVSVSGAAVGLQVRLPQHATPSRRVGGFRLTAGSVAQDLDWQPGRGVPEVVVDDPAEVLQLARAGEVRADYSVTIREVR